jgi:hypothetical protein
MVTNLFRKDGAAYWRLKNVNLPGNSTHNPPLPENSTSRQRQYANNLIFRPVANSFENASVD